MKVSAPVIFLLVLSSFSHAGEWQLKTTIDAFTDITASEAFITTPEGEKLTIIRRSDKSVWGYVQLSGINQFSIDEALLLRVDKNPPVEFNDRLEKLSVSLGRPMKTWEWNPSLIGFRMWHGEAKEGCGLIKQLFDGKVVIVRYHPNQSTTRDITFEITGGQKALSDSIAYDLSNCPVKKT